jgi:hypothetical protein
MQYYWTDGAAAGNGMTSNENPVGTHVPSHKHAGCLVEWACNASLTWDSGLTGLWLEIIGLDFIQLSTTSSARKLAPVAASQAVTIC